MTLEPIRRVRFRWAFSLRSLFLVVTMVACCFGYVMWQWRIVQERQSVIDELDMAGWQQLTFRSLPPNSSANIAHAAPQSFIRKWIGDQAYSKIIMPHVLDPKLVERITNVFPEAECEVSAVSGERKVYFFLP